MYVDTYHIRFIHTWMGVSCLCNLLGKSHTMPSFSPEATWPAVALALDIVEATKSTTFVKVVFISVVPFAALKFAGIMTVSESTDEAFAMKPITVEVRNSAAEDVVTMGEDIIVEVVEFVTWESIEGTRSVRTVGARVVDTRVTLIVAEVWFNEDASHEPLNP